MFNFGLEDVLASPLGAILVFVCGCQWYWFEALAPTLEDACVTHRNLERDRRLAEVLRGRQR